MEMQLDNQPQNNNSSYQKEDGDSKLSWYVISLFSWFFLILTIWYSYKEANFIWYSFERNLRSEEYYPIEMNITWLLLFVFLISIIGFVVYLVFTTCKKNQGLYDGMLDNRSKYHFIPLLLISLLYIIAKNAKNVRSNNYSTILENYEYLRTLISFDLIFTIFGLISLVLVYIFTELNSEWYIVMAIKKGVYPTFIILLWYNFFHMIVSFKTINYKIKINKEATTDEDGDIKFLRGTGISFTIIIGIGSLVFSFIFKDLMAAFTNFLIYMGMVFAFFNKNEYIVSQRKNYNKYADGILDIIIMICSLVCMIYLIFWCTNKLF